MPKSPVGRLAVAASSARDMVSAQLAGTTDLAPDSKTPKPAGPFLQHARERGFQRRHGGGHGKIHLGSPFLESRQSEGKGDLPSFQTSRNFMPSDCVQMIEATLAVVQCRQ